MVTIGIDLAARTLPPALWTSRATSCQEPDAHVARKAALYRCARHGAREDALKRRAFRFRTYRPWAWACRGFTTRTAAWSCSARTLAGMTPLPRR